MKRKNITNEELAGMVQRGFSETKEDVRQTEKRLVRSIEGLELKISAYGSRWSQDFEQIHNRVKELDARVDMLEKRK